MWKKMLLASAVTGLLAGAAVPIQTTPADAARSGCHKAAKARYPGDHTARKAFKRWCKSNGSCTKLPIGAALRRRPNLSKKQGIRGSQIVGNNAADSVWVLRFFTDLAPLMIQVLFFWLPARLLYELGRAYRYVLAGD